MIITGSKCGWNSLKHSTACGLLQIQKSKGCGRAKNWGLGKG